MWNICTLQSVVRAFAVTALRNNGAVWWKLELKVSVFNQEIR